MPRPKKRRLDNESPAAAVPPRSSSPKRFFGGGLKFLDRTAEGINDKICEFIRDRDAHSLDEARNRTNRLLRRAEDYTKQLDDLCQRLFLKPEEFDWTDAEDLAILLKEFWLPAFRNGVPSASEPDSIDPKSINAQNVWILANNRKKKPLDISGFQMHDWPHLVVDFCVHEGGSQQWRDTFQEFRLWVPDADAQDQEGDVKPSETPSEIESEIQALFSLEEALI